MKGRTRAGILLAGWAIVSTRVQSQLYYTAGNTQVVDIRGKDWVDKKLPPSVLILADRGGEAELKLDFSALLEKDSLSGAQTDTGIGNFADFKMDLDKQMILSHLYTGQVYNTVGFLRFNNIGKPVPVQYFLRAAGDDEKGCTMTIIIRFVPADFNVDLDMGNRPLLLQINDGIVSES